MSFAYRGRGGPSRSTPANVTCQKCLKKDMCRSFTLHLELRADKTLRHYSYECKGSAQERPYVSRPSRSQQLRNPKLVPKLTEDTPNPLEEKKGVADAELAKLDAERARKRELEERDDALIASTSKRRRSASASSVSTISTRDSRSPSPAGARGQSAASPVGASRGRRDDDHDGSRSRSRSYASRDSRSPVREQPRSHRHRQTDRRYERSVSHSAPRSRSPTSRRRHSRSPERGGRSRRYSPPASRQKEKGTERSGKAADDARERSLSPFSKRMALSRSAV